MGKGIKTRRLSEERWDVSWTGKFLHFPETDEGEREREREGEGRSWVKTTP